MLPNQGRFSRRNFLKVAGLAGTTGLLASCVPMAQPASSGSTGGAESTTAETAEMIVWDCPNSAADMPMLEDRDKMFKEAYPEVDLKVDYFLGGSTDDFKQKSVTQMASGLFPDVIYFQNSQDWVYKGVIAPLDDYLDSDAEVDWDDVLPVAQTVATWQGKRYQLPWAVNAWALYYNKEYLQENGIKLPEDYLAEDRWTWDDGFLELALAATKGEGIDRFWGVHMNTQGYWGHDELAEVIMSNGGAIFRTDPWKTALDEPEAIESLQYVLDLTKKHQVNAELGAELPEGLELEYSAIMLTGIWMLSSGAFRESFEKFGYDRMGHIRFPYGWHTDYSRNEGGAGGGMATPTDAKNPDDAWKWHKWTFNEYCKVKIADHHSQAPAKKSLATDPGFLASFASFESVDEWNYALETTVALPVPNNGSEAVNIMMAEWERVMLGEITVEEMVATVVPQMDELIKDTPPA